MANKAKKNRLIIGVALLVTVVLPFVFFGLFPSGSWTPTEQVKLNELKSQNWTLVIDGLVNRPLNLSLSDLLSMSSASISAPLYCVGSSTKITVENGTWEGVRLKSILDEAGIRANAIKVAFYAPDGFSTDLTIQDAKRNDVIVAYKKDREFLRDTNGDPDLRLVVPGKWGYKWIRSLSRIELVDYDFKGFYESMGYSDEANIG